MGFLGDPIPALRLSAAHEPEGLLEETGGSSEAVAALAQVERLRGLTGSGVVADSMMQLRPCIAPP